MPEVIYRTRDELYPRFGLALPDKQQVYVRADLPGCVKRFVVSHELYHLLHYVQATHKPWKAKKEKVLKHTYCREPFENNLLESYFC